MCRTKNRLTDREKERFFEHGLAGWMKIESSRLGDISIRDKVKILNEIEAKRKILPDTPNVHGKPQMSIRHNKWCSLHKTNLHDNSECFSQTKRKSPPSFNKKDEQKKSTNYSEKFGLLKEEVKAPAKLMFKGELKGKELNFLIDTGRQKTICQEN